MTKILLDINYEIYIIKSLTYNNTTESYKVDTEKVETWEKLTFSCPSESTTFAFIEDLFKNPPPTKIVSMYQTPLLGILYPERHFLSKRDSYYLDDTYISEF